MKRQMSRRDFLARVPLVTTGSLMAVLGEQKASATEPIQRRHGSKYKFTLAAYSYRGLLTGNQPEYTLEDFVNDCAKFGLEGTEPTSYYFPQPVTNEYLCDLKAHAFKLGLAISSTAVGNNFSRSVSSERKREIAQVKKWIDHAYTLGAPIVRIFSGNVNKQQTPEETHRLVVEAIEECCQHAAQKGVFLGLENHGGLTSTADGMLSIIRDVKSPWFGAWMDTGNFHGEDVYGELEKIAPYTLHVQVKVVTSSRGRGREPTNFRRLARNQAYSDFLDEPWQGDSF
ncbi:sugar phosphate isomerase/epimerase family protein, partial [Planctomycetota bacterium]